jgi:hypothetical protein
MYFFYPQMMEIIRIIIRIIFITFSINKKFLLNYIFKLKFINVAYLEILFKN